MEHVAPVERNITGEVIAIRILDNSAGSSFTLQASKQSLVSELKGQIASMVNTPSERHRIIYGGRVLENNQLLSSYKIQDGHTLHLITTEPVPPQTANLEVEAAAGETGVGSFPALRNRVEWGGYRERRMRRRARNIPRDEIDSIRRLNRRWVPVMEDDHNGDNENDDDNNDEADDNDGDGDDDYNENDGETRERASRSLLSGIPSHPVGRRTRGGNIRRARNITEDFELRTARVRNWLSRLHIDDGGETGDGTSADRLGLIPSHPVGLHGRVTIRHWVVRHNSRRLFDVYVTPLNPFTRDEMISTLEHTSRVITNLLSALQAARINSSNTTNNDQGETTDEPAEP